MARSEDVPNTPAPILEELVNSLVVGEGLTIYINGEPAAMIITYNEYLEMKDTIENA